MLGCPCSYRLLGTVGAFTRRCVRPSLLAFANRWVMCDWALLLKCIIRNAIFCALMELSMGDFEIWFVGVCVNGFNGC